MMIVSKRLWSSGVGAVGGSSNLIDAARRMDWSLAGTTIPTGRTKSGSTISAYSGTAGTIHTALGAAADETYVELGAGTFTLSTALNVAQKKNVTLRGQGMSTILKFTSDSGANWGWAGASCPVTIAGSPPWNADATPTIGGAPAAAATVTGSNGSAGVFTSGATVLNLGSNLSWSVGDSGALTQDDDADASLPRAGFFVSAKTDHSGSTAVGTCWQGNFDDHGAAMEHRFTVTAVNGNDVTIYPPLTHAFWKTSLNARVFKFASSTIASGVGLENVRVDTSSLGTENALIGFARSKDCWLKGVGILPNASAGGDFGIAVNDSYRITVRDGWIDTLAGGGFSTTTSYGISIQGSQFVRVENYVLNKVESPITLNTGAMGCVIGYNYEHHVTGEGGIDHHSPGILLNLIEGNSVLKITGDIFHGSSNVETCFRNHCYDRGFDLQSYNRFWNFLGNAIDSGTIRKTLSSDGTLYDRFDGFGFRFGYNGQNASINNFYNGSTNIGVAHDPDVAATAFLWYNYDTTGGTQSNSSEVPSSDATLPNAIPANNTIGSSQYFSARPGFFAISGIGTQPWPLIGPDVAGGDYLGGRAYKTPAEKMYDFTSGAIASFDPSLYGATV